ncbi:MULTISPECIES: acetyl/propionyl/methylcrotonyl-CoA carboxylase subunit alpha [Variovorax]|jgi:acetyl-CoA/propionyl-CoA carboxylase, biotin carboxylase, biotin carboxyl carrier protein|uniref:acetyl/propionyl/methylcrotonyl-CoA carboxylase subunit alpha n=1 Tax=Variovorax TaxID=34072 RepID=UPI00086D4958|nr:MULTISPECIES: biotin carboxylase N-terminal domain-containing protein [Variovorax]MBN8755026.1 ATP-grasp domain-containing protein [Variovorax sp.]ODU14842.1 MAG: acetyl/propionyl-CoA carboxylase subuit alpha [Variovorax sp. SCN 67-85]ODV26176.1 MAG: acetyl/propionyl-CoA carboxylase subuit alpha [Variovorax sp. SCN 67-20]OJZ03685.1 MAG: acetyl/propionyl-CoA carboxylase subuit alpha [Variovorax sp. 67-131]UKI07387.1 ATP-grasp domain-containing protein [Variovorax paradoxus]
MKKVLIANRGEIAVRIARACADYGVKSVAVYADADIDALHVRMADEAYGLEGDRPADTYLHIAKLLAVAARSGADAVHPGYGFLSESAAFAQAVIDAGLTWVGPSPAAIARLGDKVQARKLAMKVGAPLVAGTADPVQSAAEVLAFAEKHGLPVAIKAAFGGGGRGIKVAWRMDEVEGLYESAVREAVTAFGRGECYVEQFLDRPRHVEAQVLGDTHGNVVVLGTRDCSLQRRNQKLVEEAPAPFLSDAQRERIHQSARDICAEAGYTGAGTVEFMLSASGAISFLEVNTRLQVEHPVTEETTGIDLVVEQLRIADGLPLSVTDTPAPRGHAFEFRINAEDVGRGFLPTPGPVKVFDVPSGPGVRIDTGVAAGSTVPGTFDSLMAKLIVTGATRAQAVARARRALAEFRIEGVASVLPFHRAAMAHPDFVSGDAFKVHTRWIETDFANGETPAERPEPRPETALVRTAIEVDGRRLSLGLPPELLRGLSSAHAGSAGGAPSAEAVVAVQDPAAVAAPVSGTLQGWKVADGEEVAQGAVIAVMEAMKMEMQVLAHRAGRIAFGVAAGGYVTVGATIATIG